MLFSSPRTSTATATSSCSPCRSPAGCRRSCRSRGASRPRTRPTASTSPTRPVRDATAQWKHYRGGTHSRIWVYNVKDHEVVEIPQPKDRCNDLDPNWVGNTLYFRSDRAGEYNVFSYDAGSQGSQAGHAVHRLPGARHQHRRQEAHLRAGRLPAPADPRRVAAAAPRRSASRSTTPRPGRGSPRERSTSATSASRRAGSRVAVEFRGEIVTVPAEKGDPRNLTSQPRRPRAQPGVVAGRQDHRLLLRRGRRVPARPRPAERQGRAEEDQARRHRVLLRTRSGRATRRRSSTATTRRPSTGSTSRRGKITKIVEPKHGLGRGAEAVELVAGLEVGDLRDRHAGRRSRASTSTRWSRTSRSRSPTG